MKYLIFLLFTVGIFAQPGGGVKVPAPTEAPTFLIGQITTNTYAGVSKDAFKDTLGLVMSTKDAGVVLNDTTSTTATANVTAINTAITTLNNAGGGTLLFWGGRNDTITINNPINLKSNVDLIGKPIIWLKSISDTDMVIGNGVSNIKISGLTLDGNMANQVATNSYAGEPGQYRHAFTFKGVVSNITFENVTFQNIRYRAITTREITETQGSFQNIKIDKCNFINMGACALELRFFKDIFITNNYFEYWGIYNETTGYTAGWTSVDHPMIQMDGTSGNGFNFIFSNNTCKSTDSVLTGSNFSIVSVAIVTNAKINDNILIGDHTGVSGYWRHSSFANNIFDSSTVSLNNPWASGLEINGDHNLITNNNITNGAIYFGSHSGAGTLGNRPIKQYGSHNLIDGNKVTILEGSDNAYCFSLGGSSVDADTFSVNNTITNNVAVYRGGSGGGGYYIGQNIAGLNGVNVSDNVAVRDTIGGLTNSGVGFRIRALDSSEDITLEGNAVKGFTTGIQMDTLTDADTYSDIFILRNILDDNTNAIVNESANVIIRDNEGYVTNNSGTVTLLNGQTSIVVTHGLDITPLIQNISVTPIETLNNASFYWEDTVTSTQFTINVNADPGQDVDFAWHIID